MIGVVISFVGYLQLFFGPIQQLAQLYATYPAGMAALDRSSPCSTPRSRSSIPRAIDPPRFEGRIRFDDLSFTYEDPEVEAESGRTGHSRTGRTALGGPATSRLRDRTG